MRKQIEGFKPLTKMEILSILLSRPLEDLDMIRRIESYFRNERGYIFKLPKKHSPVILLVSGGLDTTIFWEILMKEFHLKVYPLFLRRGQIRTIKEEESVDFFHKYYQVKYPDLCGDLMKMNIFIPPFEIRWPLTKVGHEPLSKNPIFARGIPMYSSILFEFAVQYSYFLELTKHIKIRTLFCGFMPSDAGLFSYETLTSLRQINLNICTLTRDLSWQTTSLALEKELGYFFNKDVLISWAMKNEIPIERTYSCIELDMNHCGYCAYCRLRKSYFKISSQNDSTVYNSDNPPTNIKLLYNKLNLTIKTFNFLCKIGFYFISIALKTFKYLYFKNRFYKTFS